MNLATARFEPTVEMPCTQPYRYTLCAGACLETPKPIPAISPFGPSGSCLQMILDFLFELTEDGEGPLQKHNWQVRMPVSRLRGLSGQVSAWARVSR